MDLFKSAATTKRSLVITWLHSVNMARSMSNVVCLVTLFLFVTVSFADNDDHGLDAISYDKDSFQSAITEKKHFVMFFAPW